MTVSVRSVFACVLSLLLSFACAAGADFVFKPSDARVAFTAASELVRRYSPRDAGTANGRRAAELIRQQAARQGVSVRLDPFTARSRGEMRAFVNVVAELPGTDAQAPWIVLMSHFDTKPGIAGFQGANDGASTSGLLVALAGVLARRGRLRENVCLAWTDAEESRVSYGADDGFQGSKRLVAQFQAQKRTVKAAVCLDMLGDRDLNISVPLNSTPELARLAAQAAVEAGFARRVTLCDDLQILDDHAAFFDAGYPAIDFIDFDYGSRPGHNDYWHTAADTLDKISSSSLFISGRILAAFLNRLVTAEAVPSAVSGGK